MKFRPGRRKEARIWRTCRATPGSILGLGPGLEREAGGFPDLAAAAAAPVESVRSVTADHVPRSVATR